MRKASPIRAQDLVWILLFSALAWFSPYRTPIEIGLLLCLGVLQILEPRLALFATDRGAILAVLAKLGLCYLLMGWTEGINSTYYIILFLPVIAAATMLNRAGTMAVVLLTCLTYASFLLFIDWRRAEWDPTGVRQLALRLLFVPVVGFVTWQLAEANRAEARKSQAVARQLADANRSLQEAEAAVRRSDRLAALGQLTAGLAHELRNPLGTIRASAEMLARNVGAEDTVARELAGFISSEVDRTNSLITRFLEFARPLRLRLAPVSLAEVLDRAVAELERHNPPFQVSIHKNYAPDIPPLNLDAELMQRVFYNLLLNAAQATAPGGSITVKTRPFGAGAEVSVIDRGSGIPPENLESIFNPFFTTKQDGVGLGLAIVSKIVDEHGGRIALESEPGRGSVFRIFLVDAGAAGEALGSQTHGTALRY
ncbi:MAG TPA: ATP-binding protein [Bryobacteraceae bacterium]|nr:ATP-binding protein [Bryobacteraceae bacterium]